MNFDSNAESRVLWVLALLGVALVLGILIATHPLVALALAVYAGLFVLTWLFPEALALLIIVATPVIEMTVDVPILIFGISASPAILFRSAMLTLIVLYLVRHIKSIMRDRLNWIIIGFGAYLIVNSVFARNVQASMYQAARGIYDLSLFPFFTSLLRARPGIRKYQWPALIMSLVIVCGSVFYAYSHGVTTPNRVYYGVGETSGYYVTPQSVALPLVFLILASLSWPHLRKRSGTLSNLFCIALTLGGAATISLTYNRTAMLCVAVSLVLYLALFRGEKLKAKKWVRLTYAVVLIVGISYVTSQVLEPGSSWNTRVQDFGTWDEGSGRLVLYRYFLKYFWAQPLAVQLTGYGNGLDFPRLLGFPALGLPTNANNDFLDLLVALGVLGYALYISFLAILGWRFFQLLRQGRVNGYIGFVAWCVFLLEAFLFAGITGTPLVTYFTGVISPALGEYARRAELARHSTQPELPRRAPSHVELVGAR
jgi:O-Antigen ligase